MRARWVWVAVLVGLLMAPVASDGPARHVPGEVPVFVDPLEPETIPAWQTNNCTVEAATDIVHQGSASLKLTDEGPNAQVFLPLRTTLGLRYRVAVTAYRHGSNTGDWLGLAAVSFHGGRGPTTTYAARSEFITEPDRWVELSLEFEARGRRAYLILAGQNATGDVTHFDNVRVTCIGVPEVVPVPEREPAATPLVTGVELVGSPRQIGERWGTLNAQAIRDDMEQYYLAPARRAGLDEAELIRRAEKAVALAQEVAPHWIEEAHAIAAAADVEPDLYLSFVFNVYRSLWQGEDCTSFAMSPRHTEDERIFFHKNRDNVPKRQSAFIIATDRPRVNKFIAVSDASVIACMMMVNDKGLAGSADVGGIREESPRYRGWMNTALLRYIAENASDCAEALEIIEQFVDAGNYAGATHGTHWLFVDRHGTILQVANDSTRVEHRYHDDKVYFSADRGAAVTRMQELAEPVSFADFHNVSRDPATCFPQTISGMSVDISRDRPDLLTVAWISMPARSLSFPLFMGGVRTPQVLVNGEVDMAGRQSLGDFRQWEPIEEFAFRGQRRLEADVRALAAGDQTERAREALDGWVEACTRAHLAALLAGDGTGD